MKRLGEVACRDCGAVDDVVAAPDATDTPDSVAARAALVDDVGAALDRLLRRE